MAGFDFQEARRAGYSDQELLDFAAKEPGFRFDTHAALKSGYSPAEVVDHLSTPEEQKRIYTIELPDSRHIDIEAGDEDTAVNGAKEWFSQRGQAKTDTSYSGALTKGASDVVSGIGKTVKDYFNPDAGASLQAKGDTLVPQSYKPASEGFMHPNEDDTKLMGYGVGYLPRLVAEQAPGMAVDLAAAAIGKKFGGRVGQLAAGFGSNLLRSAGGEAEGRAQTRTGDANAVPSTSDKLIGGSSAAAQAALNTIGLNKIAGAGSVPGVGVVGLKQALAKMTGTAAVEGGTSAAQDVISQAGRSVGTPSGLSVDPREVGAAGLTGAATGGLFAVPKAARDAIGAIGFREHGGELSDASSAVANRMTQRAGSTDALSDPRVSYDAVNTTRQDIHNELASATKGLSITSPEASNAIARSQGGGRLNSRDFSAVDSIGDESVSNLVRQAAVVAKLTGRKAYDPGSERFEAGVAGLASRFVRNHPLLSGGAAATGSGAALASDALGLGSALGNLPTLAATAAGGFGAYKTAQALEKVLGVATPGKTFAEKFSNPNTPIRSPGLSRFPQLPTGSNAVPSSQLASPWGPRPSAVPPGQSVPTVPLASPHSSFAAPPVSQGDFLKTVEIVSRLDAAQKAREEARVSEPADPLRDALRSAKALVAVQRHNERDKGGEEEGPAFTLPEADFAHMNAADAARLVLERAKTGGVPIRHEENYLAATKRRLTAEEKIYSSIARDLPNVQARQVLHPMHAALWGADSPGMAKEVRDHFMTLMPEHAALIEHHLPDSAIAELWATKTRR